MIGQANNALPVQAVQDAMRTAAYPPLELER
jgi:hypothetical protein